MKLTADTISDEEIRELALTSLTAAQHRDCELALQKRDRHWTRFQRTMQRNARARCAEILNARHAEAVDALRNGHGTVAQAAVARAEMLADTTEQAVFLYATRNIGCSVEEVRRQLLLSGPEIRQALNGLERAQRIERRKGRLFATGAGKETP